MSMDRIQLILDTDMGPDCDDAGALALLHILSREHPIDFLAITNCTSNPYACGTIDAINRFYGHGNIPIGTYEKPGFLEDGYAQKYNRFITENYINVYRPPVAAPSAQKVLKNALHGAQRSSVVMLSIGPLNNMANLINDAEGYALVKNKVSLFVTMCTGLEKPEWNIERDISSAMDVFDKWPTPIVISVAETGGSIITGRSFGSMSADNPVRVAYKLFNNGDKKCGRMSWDLTAAWYAISGVEPFFFLSPPCDVIIDAAGLALYYENPDGNCRILHNKMDPKEISTFIDTLWTN